METMPITSIEINRRELLLQRLVVSLTKVSILELCEHSVEEVVQGFFDKEYAIARDAEIQVAKDIVKSNKKWSQEDFFTNIEGDQNEVHKQS